MTGTSRSASLTTGAGVGAVNVNVVEPASSVSVAGSVAVTVASSFAVVRVFLGVRFRRCNGRDVLSNFSTSSESAFDSVSDDFRENRAFGPASVRGWCDGADELVVPPAVPAPE